jgi:methylmalonyl-CoA mutase
VAAALEQGSIQKLVATARRQREAAIASRKEAITGTSEFPDLHDPAVSVLDVAPLQAAPDKHSAVTCEAMPPLRLAEPFERLRDASDRAMATTAMRPKIFLANLGNASDFTARATLAKNFFEAGGIETIWNAPQSVSSTSRSESAVPGQYGDEAALAAAFKASGATVVCLCSSDKIYANHAADAARVLAEAGAAHIYLAGRPRELEPSLTEAGVKSFIYAGCDTLGILQDLHARLGLR